MKCVDPLLSRTGVVYLVHCRTGVVYMVPCSYGKVCIGEIKRALGTHIKEHQTATKTGETDKSAIAEHACDEEKHQS